MKVNQASPTIYSRTAMRLADGGSRCDRALIRSRSSVDEYPPVGIDVFMFVHAFILVSFSTSALTHSRTLSRSGR